MSFEFWVLNFELLPYGNFEFWILSFELFSAYACDCEFMNFDFWVEQFKIEQFLIGVADQFKTQNSKLKIRYTHSSYILSTTSLKFL